MNIDHQIDKLEDISKNRNYTFKDERRNGTKIIKNPDVTYLYQKIAKPKYRPNSDQDHLNKKIFKQEWMRDHGNKGLSPEEKYVARRYKKLQDMRHPSK